MRVTSVITFTLLALLSLISCEEIKITLKARSMGSLSARATVETSAKRQIDLGGLNLGRNSTSIAGAKGQLQGGNKGNSGGFTIGGLTLGGPGGGIVGNAINNGGNRQGQQAQGGQGQEGEAQEGQQAAAGISTEGTTAVEGQKTSKQFVAEGQSASQAGVQGQKVQEAVEAEKSNGVKATDESERFSEEAGITLDQNGNAANLGGNLGITQGSDGSKSVGGANGINIAANGEATLSGNET